MKIFKAGPELRAMAAARTKARAAGFSKYRSLERQEPRLASGQSYVGERDKENKLLITILGIDNG
jgi:hypothetical protein